MRLKLHRTFFLPTHTAGELYVGHEFECFTLEDVVRPAGAPKVYGQTAISAGAYSVIIDQSKRFGRLLPLLLNVVGFTGVRIHPGNVATDTDGCILTGMQYDESTGRVTESRKAFDALFAKMLAASPAAISIEIVDSR